MAAQQQPPKNNPDPPSQRWRIPLWYILLAILLLWVWQGVFQGTVHTIPYSDFKAYLARGEVVSCTLRQDEVLGVIKPNPRNKKAKVKEPEGPPDEFNFRHAHV